jgi:hypothetical protein
MSDPLLLLLEKDRIIDTINQLFISTDKRDWPGVRRCFADSVLFDMTSLAGGKPTPMTPEQISAVWEQGLRPIESIHHQAGNYRVDIHGEQATAFCYGIALHYRRTRSGQNTRTFVGSYDFHLLRLEGRWRIDSFRFNLKFLDGNLELEQAE